MTSASTAAPSEPPLIPDGHFLDFSRTGIAWLDRLLDTAAVIVLATHILRLESVGKKIWVINLLANNSSANSFRASWGTDDPFPTVFPGVPE